jgi:flagellar protein FlgJ
VSGVEKIGAPAETPDRDARLRRAAQQMEGVFYAQLLRAMRETVPQEGARGGTGEEIFTGLLDEKVAETAAARAERGVGAALYRQLRARIESTRGTET